MKSIDDTGDMYYSVKLDQNRNARIDAVGVTVNLLSEACPIPPQPKATITYWDYLDDKERLIAFYPDQLDDLMALLRKVRREILGPVKRKRKKKPE